MVYDATEGGESSPPLLSELPPIPTKNAVPDEFILANVAQALARNLPELRQGPETSEPIAIVGGGPSLKRTLPDLWAFQKRGGKVCAAGSVHDFLIANDIVPWCAAAIDPMLEMAAYYRNPHADVIYLIASMCAPTVFDALEGHNVVLWHADVGLNPSGLPEKRTHIKGGNTIVLRCIWLLAEIGFRDLHFYGFDGCDDPESGAHHAYSAVPDGDAYRYRVGSPDGPEFTVRGALIAQAQGWQTFLRDHGRHFKLTIHGDGLMAEIAKQMYGAAS